MFHVIFQMMKYLDEHVVPAIDIDPANLEKEIELQLAFGPFKIRKHLSCI